MNHFLLNGIEKALPELQSPKLQDLILQLRSAYSGDTLLISSIRVNGIEINTEDEKAIGEVPVSQLRSLEIFTSHPKEVAEETLQSLVEFSLHLEALCAGVGADPETLRETLPKLADGIETFTQALLQVKQILRIVSLPSVQILEADLASILTDIFQYQRKKEPLNAASVVAGPLVENLAQWRLEGIPTLIRLRDN